MEIKSLVDLNNFRTAPQLSDTQLKSLLEELEVNILNSDWITIGIMAPSQIRAIKYYSQFLKNIHQLNLGTRFFMLMEVFF